MGASAVRPDVVVSGGHDYGAALILALLAAAIALGVGLAAAALADLESGAASAYRDGVEAFYAADGVLESVQDEMGQIPSWTPVLTGAVCSRVTDFTLQPVTPLSGPVHLTIVTASLQAQSDAAASWGANNPRWRLFGYGPVSSLWPAAGPAGLLYGAAWIADDTGETDGDPLADANGAVRIRVEVRGRRGSRRIVEAVIERTASGVVRQVSWREVR